GGEARLVAVDPRHQVVRGDDPEPGAVDELEQRVVVAEQPRDGRLGVPGDAAVAAQLVERVVRHPRQEGGAPGEVDVDDVGHQAGIGRRLVGRGGPGRHDVGHGAAPSVEEGEGSEATGAVEAAAAG